MRAELLVLVIARYRNRLFRKGTRIFSLYYILFMTTTFHDDMVPLLWNVFDVNGIVKVLFAARVALRMNDIFYGRYIFLW